MLKKTLLAHSGLGLLLLAVACGDDKGGRDEDPTGMVADDGGPIVRGDAGPDRNDMDAGLSLDGAIPDVPVVTLPDGAVVTVQPDGSTSPVTAPDAGNTTPTTPDAAAPGTSLDAAADDAAVADAAVPPTTTVDAATPGNPADAGCTINDPAFGCGVAVTADWIRFNNGYEYDRANNRVWAPAIVPASDLMLSERCFTINVGGVEHIFDVPMMDEVRMLAAGCAATVTDGACGIQTDEEFPPTNGECSCPGGTGPHASGGFCRPEVGNCETIWTRTYCGPNPTCTSHDSWFYDVTTGSVVLKNKDDDFAKAAKLRCVSKYVSID